MIDLYQRLSDAIEKINHFSKDSSESLFDRMKMMRLKQVLESERQRIPSLPKEGSISLLFVEKKLASKTYLTNNVIDFPTNVIKLPKKYQRKKRESDIRKEIKGKK